MSSRVIAGAVIVLVLVVGGIMLLVGSLNGGDSDKGDNGTIPVPAYGVPGGHLDSGPAAAGILRAA